MNRKTLYIIFACIFLLGSCDKKDDFVNEYSKTVELAGDWFVLYNHGVFGTDPFGAGYTNAITFNTAANDENFIWISDEGHFWDYKVKVPCNLSDLTFGGGDTVINAVDGYPIKVVVRNGKIIKNASLQPSETMADSIYFEIWFEDLVDATGIANDTLLVSGFRRTGFLEDEH